MCFTTGVQELPGVDKLIEPTHTIDLGFIRDATNPLARKVRRRAKIITKIYKNQIR